MKNLALGILIGVGLIACRDTDSIHEEFTGNETVYALEQGSDYNVSGSVFFKEKVDGTTVIEINLSGTEDGLEHPAHLHLGNISSPAADIAALLNPVAGTTGRSETHLIRLADESLVSYRQLIELDACMKIHLATSGPSRDIILAGGNIGKAAADLSGARSGIGVCKSE